MIIDVSRAFGAQDQRERIDSRITDAASREFVQQALRADLAAMSAQVRAGYDINTAGPDGVTPAMAYVSYVRPVRADVLARMIELGADITRPMANNMSLLNGLARAEDPGVLKVLLAAGVSPDIRLPAIRETFLSVAIQENNTALALGLLQAGADPGLAAVPGRTPLQAAVGLGNWVVADALMRAGADPRQGDPDLSRLAHALDTSPPAAGTAQAAAHTSVGDWFAAQRRAARPPAS